MPKVEQIEKGDVLRKLTHLLLTTHEHQISCMADISLNES